MTIPSFLLGRGPRIPRAGKGAPVGGRRNIGPPPWRGPHATLEGVVTLVEAVDTTQPHGGAIRGGVRLPGYLADIDVGTVLVHRPVDPAIPPLERPWQAGRVHLDGVHWEEKTWPDEDVIAFRDHVVSLMEFTVPGDAVAPPSAGAETPTRRK